jgi:hypothetical protein
MVQPNESGKVASRGLGEAIKSPLTFRSTGFFYFYNQTEIQISLVRTASFD